jgi:copper(I)-binding protein
MRRTKKQIRAAFKFVLVGPSPPARHDADVFYVGLGNEFDDDRRLVRVSASALLIVEQHDLVRDGGSAFHA